MTIVLKTMGMWMAGVVMVAIVALSLPGKLGVLGNLDLW